MPSIIAGIGTPSRRPGIFVEGMDSPFSQGENGYR